MSQVLGYLVLAMVVPLYLRWEWNQSESDRRRRAEMTSELKDGTHA
jgi:hypothetical protein